MLTFLRLYGWAVGAGLVALALVVLGQGVADVLRERTGNPTSGGGLTPTRRRYTGSRETPRAVRDAQAAPACAGGVESMERAGERQRLEA
jgi:hypothetical protein